MKKKLLFILLLLITLLPFNIYAYSNKVILGGENIGIDITTDKVLIVGLYKVNNKKINNHLEIGDKILKINNKDINNIKDMNKELENNYNKDKINITIERNNREIETTLNIEKENNIIKTGLYVKDRITGIGTITYIDPESKTYGALGHEIIESYSNKKANTNSGKIYSSSITGINKSTSNKTGEKKANIDTDQVLGNIKENTINGIFGTYFDDINSNTIEISTDIKLGDAYIYTVLNNKEKTKYKIEILKIDKNSKTKNIFFKIKDKNLLDKTNGIIKGMSGSPIVQDNKLVGAVTHAIQTKNKYGYGILIESMLKEGDS